ncbi:MAG: hypothetical protein RAK20_02205 [Conexivisphaerales archaeon]|jgi:hypothetical protein|nr:hypothetical protein [Conexivisphaerales archaeon]
MAYKIGLVLDEERLKLIKGTELEKEIKDLFGGTLKMIEVEVTEEQAKILMQLFPRVRIDARGFVEETPVAFRKALYRSLINHRSKKDALEAILKDDKLLNEIKEMASKEDEYIPPP